MEEEEQHNDYSPILWKEISLEKKMHSLQTKVR